MGNVRQCIVVVNDNGQQAAQKALFHAWDNEGNAVVEFENGMMAKAQPNIMRFIDSYQVFRNYAWPGEQQTHNEGNEEEVAEDVVSDGESEE